MTRRLARAGAEGNGACPRNLGDWLLTAISRLLALTGPLDRALACVCAPGRPKIKLYLDEAGKPKGDALVTYYRPESVSLAVQLLDGTEFRLGKSGAVHVEEVGA